MTPKEMLKEIESGSNLIFNFWNVRGYSKVTHCLGMDISFHRPNPRYEHNGLSLIYLEQFYAEAQERAFKIILELIKVEKVTRIGYLKERIEELKNNRTKRLKQELKEFVGKL